MPNEYDLAKNGMILPSPPYEWQSEAWVRFLDSIKTNHLPHAHLLVSDKGVGSEALAEAMAQYLLCLAPQADHVCGKCKSCQLMQAGTHPDLLLVAPEGKANQIKIDQIRALSEFVNKTSQQGGPKVVMLSPAENMNTNSANALLKNLEEPASNTFFFLVSTEPAKLLPTIKSRCSIMSLANPSPDQAKAWLTSVGIDDEYLYLLNETHGAPLTVKQWIDDNVVETRTSVVADLVAMVNFQLTPIEAAKKWAGLNAFDVLSVLVNICESMIAGQVGGRPLYQAYEPIYGGIKHHGVERLFRLRDRLVQKRHLLSGSSNLNEALAIEEVLIDWSLLMRRR